LVLTDVSFNAFQTYTRWVHLGKLNPHEPFLLKKRVQEAIEDSSLAVYDDGDDRFHCPYCSDMLDPEPAGITSLDWSLGSTPLDECHCVGCGSSLALDERYCDGCDLFSDIYLRDGVRRQRTAEVAVTGWTSTFMHDSDLLDLYQFAWKYEIIPLRRDIITLWLTQDNERNSLPDWATIRRAFLTLPAKAPLRQYFVDVSAYYWRPDPTNPAEFSAAPKAFTLQYMMSYINRCPIHPVPIPYMPDVCAYHDHGDNCLAEELCRDARRAQDKVRQAKKAAFEASLRKPTASDCTSAKASTTTKNTTTFSDGSSPVPMASVQEKPVIDLTVEAAERPNIKGEKVDRQHKPSKSPQLATAPSSNTLKAQVDSGDDSNQGRALRANRNGRIRTRDAEASADDNHGTESNKRQKVRSTSEPDKKQQGAKAHTSKPHKGRQASFEL